MIRKKIRKILLVLLAALVVSQFFRIDKTNPTVKDGADFLVVNNTNNEIGNILKNACYDCHSNETKYPWYSNIAPISFWIIGHIDHARGHLNFSEWVNLDRDKRDHKLEECVDMVEKKWMPIGTYKLMHSEARISDQQRDELIAYFQSLR